MNKIVIELDSEMGRKVIEFLSSLPSDNTTSLRSNRSDVASEWLIERFREKLEWESEELFRVAREHGIGRNAIFEAKSQLNIPRARRITRDNGDALYVWWVPASWEGFNASPGT